MLCFVPVFAGSAGFRLAARFLRMTRMMRSLPTARFPLRPATDRDAHGKFATVLFDAAFPHGRHGRGDGRHQSACAILQYLFVTVEIVEYVAEILPRTGHVDRESESLRSVDILLSVVDEKRLFGAHAACGDHLAENRL